MIDQNFKNGCVLIVGGSGGIGSLCAEEFSNSGAKVAITYYKNEQAAINLANEIDTNVNIYQLDNSNSKSVEDTFAQVVKDFARSHMSQENSAAGIFGQDDGENFEQITASAHGFIASHQEFDYTMGLGHEGEIQEPGYRGQLGPHFSEQNHRNYYRYYLELMTNAGLSDG